MRFSSQHCNMKQFLMAMAEEMICSFKCMLFICISRKMNNNFCILPFTTHITLKKQVRWIKSGGMAIQPQHVIVKSCLLTNIYMTKYILFFYVV